MSDPIDIKALDEYLKGGSEISARYRETGREDVPPELDRRVLDAARAAVASEGTKRPRSWLRWSAPVALAASVVLAVTVVVERGVQNDELVVPQAKEATVIQSVPQAPAVVLQSRPAAAPPAADAAKAEAPAQAPTMSSERVTQDVAVEEELARQEVDAAMSKRADAPPAAQSVRAAANDAADVDSSQVDEIAVTSSHTRRAAGRTAGPRGTVPASAFRGEARQSAEAQQSVAPPERSDPEKWLEEIRGLRRAGKAVEADREWQSFRETFPDYTVADDDIARASSDVKR
ncbi:MAG TPA: hypothetical protein VJQ52_01810 [Steroidobacteraceae bacterium]|nr:hypothetical protein [Steroidobacteraceae bacterium]